MFRFFGAGECIISCKATEIAKQPNNFNRQDHLPIKEDIEVIISKYLSRKTKLFDAF